MSQVTQTSPRIGGDAHYEWIDVAKGMAILWIVYFHGFSAAYWNDLHYVMPGTYDTFVRKFEAGSLWPGVLLPIQAVIAFFMQQGQQAVGVFLLLSGFGLTYAVLRRSGEVKWGRWYARRLLRLYPVYWLGHLITLATPYPGKSVWFPALDYRFFLSLLGDRFVPVREIFFYLNPPWWFFGLVIELYAVFPVLLWLLRRLGPLPYLVLCAAAAAGSRYVILYGIEAKPEYVQGAFFMCRLWEFGAGMALGKLMVEKPLETKKWLLSFRGFLPGLAVYALSLFSYKAYYYCFTEGLNGMGLSLVLIYIAGRLARIRVIGKALALAGVYSYGIFILHYPFIFIACEKMSSFHIGDYYVAATGAAIVIAAASALAEYAVNRLVSVLRGLGGAGREPAADGLKQ